MAMPELHSEKAKQRSKGCRRCAQNRHDCRRRQGMDAIGDFRLFEEGPQGSTWVSKMPVCIWFFRLTCTNKR